MSLQMIMSVALRVQMSGSHNLSAGTNENFELRACRHTATALILHDCFSQNVMNRFGPVCRVIRPPLSPLSPGAGSQWW